jgi:hypothetical protein
VFSKYTTPGNKTEFNWEDMVKVAETVIQNEK